MLLIGRAGSPLWKSVSKSSTFFTPSVHCTMYTKLTLKILFCQRLFTTLKCPCVCVCVCVCLGAYHRKRWNPYLFLVHKGKPRRGETAHGEKRRESVLCSSHTWKSLWRRNIEVEIEPSSQTHTLNRPGKERYNIVRIAFSTLSSQWECSWENVLFIHFSFFSSSSSSPCS